MAVGKITGQMLGDTLGNLDRDGVDLAFDTDLIYLDVINRRVGVKTTSPNYELQVIGTTRTTNLEVTNTANIADITISGNNIFSNTSVLNLAPPSGSHVVYQNKLIIDDLQLEGNHIRTINSNANLEISANGTGTINLNSNVEITGNLHATGTITADGNITLGDADTDNIIFNADVASDIIPDVDNVYKLGRSDRRWNDIWVNSLTASTINTGGFEVAGIDITTEPGNTYFVSINGDDGNVGKHPQDPLSSIGRALDLATAGDTVYIYPGTYSETLPLTIPAGVTVKGTGIRSVTIQPDSDDTVDMFLLNGECTVEDITITGFKFDSGTNTGYAFKFAPGMTVTSRSPYIRNVTVITQGSVTSGSDPRGFLTGDAGKGAYLDGSIVNAASNEAACLFHSVTFICPGVDALTCTNGVRVEWLNCFTYFADRSIYAFSGSLGFAGDGKTRVKITNKTGTFNVGNTLSYYDVDGTTVLASGTIQSIDGDFYVIDGKVLGFESLVDRNPKTIFANGNAALSTAQKKFGTASLYLDGAGDFITVLSQADFAFGTGDYTLEFFVRPDALGTLQVIYDARTAATDLAIYLEINAAGNVRFFFNGGYRITSSVAVTAAVWNHVVLARESGTTRLFVNGTLTLTTYADANNYPARSVRIGNSWTGGSGFAGYIDDLRICKGAAKYTASYVVPTSALTGDNSTVLLAHFDGPNGSTSFLDDGITLQDVRTSAGGTASIIDFADYNDFGAEIRSIASASVYGNYGVYGDGDGVIGYFISHNMGYIGSGRLSNNDPTYIPDDSTNVNEVVKINRAKIYFTTVDNKGDFRVGEFFYVNQRDGTVVFDESDFTITSSTGITFTDGSNITEVTPTYIQTGNIKISGNTIESIVNGMTLTAANNEITATSNVTVTGTLTVDDNFTVTGNTIIGDSTSDTITFNAEVVSNFVPDVNTTFNLGSTTNQWNRVYLAEAIIDDISISGNLIRTTVSNSNLELRAAGTGVVRIDQLDFNDNSITSNTTNTNININPNGTGTIQLQKDTYVTGNLDVTGNITLGGNIQIGDQTSDTINLVGSITNNLIPAVTATYNIGNNSLRWRNLYSSKVVIDDIEIDSNVIQTTVSNQNLELRANGTGAVRIDQLDFNDNTISSNSTNADININPNGTGTIQLQKNSNVTGTLTVSGNVALNGNTTIGDAQSDTVTFIARFNSDLIPAYTSTYNIGSNSLRWQNLYTSKAVIDDIEIDTNLITTRVSNQDLELRANGTGSIRIDQLDFNDNSIVSNTTNTDININPNGTGTIQLQKDTYVTGNLTVTGTTSITGSIVLGDSFSDTVSFLASVSSDVLPTANSYYSLGAQNYRWATGYFSKVVVDDIVIDTNVIQSTLSNQNLELRANGTGSVQVDLLNFKSNTITSNSTNTDIQINPNGTGRIKLQKDTDITGNLDVTGNITLGGNITIGNQTSDNINVVGSITNNLIPSVTGLFDIGSTTLTWRNLYAAKANINDIEINDNYISTTASNADLELRANGTGVVRITDNFTVDQNLTVSGSTSLQNTTVTGTLTTSNLTVSNVLTAGTYSTGDIEISGNVIRTVNSNSNLELRANGTGAVYAENLSIQQSTISGLVAGQDIEITPSGTGIVKINSDQAISIPVGTQAQRPSGVAGMIRYNSDINQYEGYNGSYWMQLGGVIDVDRNTYVIPELSPGSNENTIYFYADGALAATLTSTEFNANKINVDQITIDGNVISTNSTNADLELRPNGSGAVVIDGFRITTNTLTNTNSGAVTEFRSTGNGYYYISGTNAVGIPAGTPAQRPGLGVATVGMIRYNTTDVLVEVFDGVNWGSVAGAAAGITFSAAEDIGLAQALIFG